MTHAKVYCVYLLGELRADEAVPALLTLIDFEGVPDHNSNRRRARWGRYPASEALAKIGSPAVGPVTAALGDESGETRRKLMVRVLRDILGSDTANFVLQRAVDSANGTKAANYKQAKRELAADGH